MPAVDVLAASYSMINSISAHLPIKILRPLMVKAVNEMPLASSATALTSSTQGQDRDVRRVAKPSKVRSTRRPAREMSFCEVALSKCGDYIRRGASASHKPDVLTEK
jgi:hypothetical protein